MKIVKHVSDVINPRILAPGSVIYSSGNAATPQLLLEQLADDPEIRHVALYGVLLLGERLKKLFSEERCRQLTHRVLFNGQLSREAVNNGWAKYHPMHLSEIPRYARLPGGPNVVFVGVSGPDPGGNYSLGTTVEGVLAAIGAARNSGGIVIAERNRRMPFVLGSTIPESYIDYLIDSEYPLPCSPVQPPDETARRIGEIVAALYIDDGSGSTPGSTLQYGIGEVPEAVTDAIIRKGLRDLAIHTELFADAMIRLVKLGIVTNRWKERINFSVSSIFLAAGGEGYDWYNFNSSVQSRPCDYTNSIFRIAEQPKMVTINSAIGVDLHGNVWADSLEARRIYSGIGGQSDFIRGAQYSPGGLAIVALKSRTREGVSKIVDKCPPGITTTAVAADQVIIVTEYGAFDPRRLSLGERAVGIAHLAAPEAREQLLKAIYEDHAFHRPYEFTKKGVRGLTTYEEALRRL